MSRPVSSRARQDALQCSVLVGVAGDSVLPAAPYDLQPSPSADADGVYVVVAAVAGSSVEVVGPGVGGVGVAGKVGDGAAQLLVDSPAERDDFDLAGLSCRGSGPGETDQKLWGGVAAAGVADLGEQADGAHGAGARQRAEDVAVGVGGELRGDLVLEGLDLGADGAKRGDQREGDRSADSSSA